MFHGCDWMGENCLCSFFAALTERERYGELDLSEFTWDTIRQFGLYGISAFSVIAIALSSVFLELRRRRNRKRRRMRDCEKNE